MSVIDHQSVKALSFDQFPCAVLIHEADGRLKLINRQASDLLGWDRDAPDEHHIQEALSGFTPEDYSRVVKQVRDTLDTSFAAMVRTKDDIRPYTAIVRCNEGVSGPEWFSWCFTPIQSELSEGYQERYEELALRLSRRDDIMQAISVGAARYLEVDDVGTSAPFLLNQTASAAQVSRAYVFCNHNLGEDGVGATRIIEYKNSPRDGKEQAATISYATTEFGRWARKLSMGEVLSLTEDQIVDSAFWSAPCLCAVLLPIFAHGEWWGFMGFEDDSQLRSWQSEQDALKMVAGLFGLAVEREYEKNRRQQHEAELAHHSRLSIVGEMASGMAHELNQPLAAIVNYCQVSLNLLDQDNRTDLLRDAIEKTAYQAKRSADIISRIRNFARKDEASIEHVGINEVVTDALEFAHHKIASQRTEVQVDLLENDLTIAVCVVQIEQVVLNLLLNALDSVSVPTASENKITLSIQEQDQKVVVSVRDHGEGVADVIKARIFEPFESSKKDGLGMGLTISRTIIEAHDGKLEVDDSIDRGACFYFSLPVGSE